MNKLQVTIRYRSLLLGGFLVILIIVIVLSASYMYAFNKNYVINRAVANQTKALEHVGSSFSEFLSEIDLIAATISEHSDIVNLLSDNLSDSYQQVANSRQIESILSSFVYANYNKIDGMNIVSSQFSGINQSSQNGIISEEYISSSLSDTTYKTSDSGWVFIQSLDVQVAALELPREHVLAFYKTIYYKNTHKSLGTLFIYFPKDALYRIIRPTIVDASTQGAVVYEDSIVLAHADSEKIGEQISSLDWNQDEQNRLLTWQTPNRNWTIFLHLDLNMLTQDLQVVRHFILLLSIIILSIGMMFSLLLSAAITGPLKQLTTSVSTTKDRLKENTTNYYIEEVNSLNHEFNGMIEHILLLLKDIERKQAVKHEMEIKLLQAQINPHFIYNTIELINYAALKDGNAFVSQIAHSFGRFFRLSLNEGKDYLTVAQELEHVKSYITLQQLKFENRFVVEWDIDDSTLQGYTLKLILQPLVENSITHGLAENGGHGTIAISVERKDTLVEFIIEDSGNAMTPQQAQAILLEDTAGYGVYNIHKRIRSKFGAACGVSYRTSVLGGTAAIVTIPYLERLSELEKEDDYV